MALTQDPRVAGAVRHFWETRLAQAARQGGEADKDRGGRSAATGGAQMAGFAEILRDLVVKRGFAPEAVHWKQRLQLPGYFRPTKDWDLFVVVEGRLLAAIEFKSQVGPSFGNNFNNRTEEAIGNAVDLLAAHRQGAFRRFPAPWLGWLMLLEDAPGSTRPVDVKEPHYPIFPEFRGASYAKRYELLCLRLMEEHLYDGTCLLLSSATGGLEGGYAEPAGPLSFRAFAASLAGRLDTFLEGTSSG